MHKLGHAFLQRLFIDLVRQFINDDGLPLAFVDIFKVALGPHDDFAAPGAVAIFDAIDTVNNASSRKVGRRDDVHQLINRGIRVLQQMKTSIDRFVKVVRWNIGGHTNCNA